MAEPNISKEVWIEDLEKLPDGTYKKKNHIAKAKDGTTFDEHLANNAKHIDDYIKHPGYATTTGTNAYNITLSPPPTSLLDGMGVVIKVGTNATGNCTLNINGLGAKNILKADGSVVTDLKFNSIYTLRYNGVNFTLQGEGGDNLNFKERLPPEITDKTQRYLTGLSENRWASYVGSMAYLTSFNILNNSGLVTSIVTYPKLGNELNFMGISHDEKKVYWLQRGTSNQIVISNLAGNYLSSHTISSFGSMVRVFTNNEVLFTAPMGSSGNTSIYRFDNLVLVKSPVVIANSGTIQTVNPSVDGALFTSSTTEAIKVLNNGQLSTAIFDKYYLYNTLLIKEV